jgi:hypothetical protein
MKKLRKGKQEWELECKEAILRFQKLKTLVKAYFVSKLVFFNETLEYFATK